MMIISNNLIRCNSTSSENHSHHPSRTISNDTTNRHSYYDQHHPEIASMDRTTTTIEADVVAPVAPRSISLSTLFEQESMLPVIRVVVPPSEHNNHANSDISVGMIPNNDEGPNEKSSSIGSSANYTPNAQRTPTYNESNNTTKDNDNTMILPMISEPDDISTMIPNRQDDDNNNMTITMTTPPSSSFTTSSTSSCPIITHSPTLRSSDLWDCCSNNKTNNTNTNPATSTTMTATNILDVDDDDTLKRRYNDEEDHHHSVSPWSQIVPHYHHHQEEEKKDNEYSVVTQDDKGKKDTNTVDLLEGSMDIPSMDLIVWRHHLEGEQQCKSATTTTTTTSDQEENHHNHDDPSDDCDSVKTNHEILLHQVGYVMNEEDDDMNQSTNQVIYENTSIHSMSDLNHNNNTNDDSSRNILNHVDRSTTKQHQQQRRLIPICEEGPLGIAVRFMNLLL
jgi:hypothetical protein